MVQRSDEGTSWAKGAEQNYEAFRGRLGQKALAAVEKHAELCEGNADLAFGKCWKRLAGGLGKLAPHAIETAGHQALKFHIPDGKYRQQVFALEDHCDGWVRVYLPDVTAAAVERKILKLVSGAD